MHVMVCEGTTATDGLTKTRASTCESTCPMHVCALETSLRVSEGRAGREEIVNTVVILNVINLYIRCVSKETN